MTGDKRLIKNRENKKYTRLLLPFVLALIGGALLAVPVFAAFLRIKQPVTSTLSRNEFQPYATSNGVYTAVVWVYNTKISPPLNESNGYIALSVAGDDINFGEGPGVTYATTDGSSTEANRLQGFRPKVVFDPTDNTKMYVAFIESPDNKVRLATATITKGLAAGIATETVPGSDLVTYIGSSLGLAAGSGGNLHIVFPGSNTGECNAVACDIYQARKSGGSWDTTANTGLDGDWPDLAIQGTTLHMALDDWSTDSIFYANRSGSSAAGTWSSGLLYFNSDASEGGDGNATHPSIAFNTGSDGCLLWEEEDSEEAKYLVAYNCTTNGGTGWITTTTTSAFITVTHKLDGIVGIRGLFPDVIARPDDNFALAWSSFIPTGAEWGGEVVTWYKDSFAPTDDLYCAAGTVYSSIRTEYAAPNKQHIGAASLVPDEQFAVVYMMGRIDDSIYDIWYHPIPQDEAAASGGTNLPLIIVKKAP